MVNLHTGSSEDSIALKPMLTIMNKKIDSLTDDLKTLSQVVKMLVDRESGYDGVQAKTTGGRTSVSFVFFPLPS